MEVEESEKLEKSQENTPKDENSEKHDEKSKENENPCVELEKPTPDSDPQSDIPEVAKNPEKSHIDDQQNVVEISKEVFIEIKVEETTTTSSKGGPPKDASIAIVEECDTGGDEVPPIGIESNVVIEKVEGGPQELSEEPELLTELTTVVPEPSEEIASSGTNKSESDVVALDDDDEEEHYLTHEVDDSERDEDDDDEDVEGVSNEALNDEDEEDDDDDAKSSQEALETDDYDEDDDDDEDNVDEDDEMVDLKDDSNGAVVIGSSDEDEPPPTSREPPQKPIAQQLQSFSSTSAKPSSKPVVDVGSIEDIELDYDEDEEEEAEDDDEDDYDDDDLMNAVVTSAAAKGGLSSTKKRPRSESPVAGARQKEAQEINVLTRRINYGRIAKKKSLNWLYNKKKREAYKSILPRHKPRNYSEAEAMRSDQSGGLLHLKISSPSVTLIGQKAVNKASTSTPTISRVQTSSSRPGPASRTQINKPKEDCVIDLDSSPEKTQDKLIINRPHQSDDQRKLEFDLKKPPDTNKETESSRVVVEIEKDKESIEQDPSKMQQTDKVRDSIQKSTEEVEEVKSAAVDRLKCEQNKENLQSNEAPKKETESESVKLETEAKDAAPTTMAAPLEAMDTSEQISNDNTTIKPTNLTISSTASSQKVDIKEEKPDNDTATPCLPSAAAAAAAAEEASAASKVTIEDVPEKETISSTYTPHVGTTTNKRRRSSSSNTGEKSKTSKSAVTTATTPSTETNQQDDDIQDDDEEYIHPTKKLREELQIAYPAHDRILNEYIEKTSNDSLDSIQRHIDQMVSEIHTLNDMIKAKEIEWNNMLHLKKVKEEICFRLTRRKQCLEIMSTKVGEAAGVRSAGLDEDYMGNESAIILGKHTPAKPNIQQLSSTPIQAAINTLSSNICNFTAVSSSSSTAPTTAQLLIQNRANMKSSDLVKEKANTLRLHRNILPKPNNTQSPNTSNISTANNTHQSQQQQQHNTSTNGPSSTQPNASNQPILNSYLTSTDSVQQLVDMMNGHHNHNNELQNGGNMVGASQTASQQAAAAAAMVGRQGPFKDVRSIIADFRQQHPEVVPRRGRRNSRPSSNDSSSQGMTSQNPVTTNHNSVNSFKDVLAPFSKSQVAGRSAGGQQQNPPYPEVTLHPVSTPLNASGGQDQPTGSLLHGILTKFSRPTESANTKSVANQASANYISNFSPTLARLLTAPERISPSGPGSGPNSSHHQSSSIGIGGGGGVGGVGVGGDNIHNTSSGHHSSLPNFGVNLSKVVGHNSEITITPVMNSMHQQSILQQQLQQQQIKDVLQRAAAAVGASANNSAKEEHFLKLSSFVAPSSGPNNDDDAEDSVDRLVIDEGDLMTVGGEEHRKIAPHAIGQEFNENEVPVCQGCKKHEAQFVCAGCGNQWYCSRECQVTAWDDHSEVCTATKQIRNNFNMLKSRDLDNDEEYLIIRRRKRNKGFPQFY